MTDAEIDIFNDWFVNYQDDGTICVHLGSSGNKGNVFVDVRSQGSTADRSHDGGYVSPILQSVANAGLKL